MVGHGQDSPPERTGAGKPAEREHTPAGPPADAVTGETTPRDAAGEGPAPGERPAPPAGPPDRLATLTDQLDEAVEELEAADADAADAIVERTGRLASEAAVELERRVRSVGGEAGAEQPGADG